MNNVISKTYHGSTEWTRLRTRGRRDEHEAHQDGFRLVIFFRSAAPSWEGAEHWCWRVYQGKKLIAFGDANDRDEAMLKAELKAWQLAKAANQPADLPQ